MEREQTTFTTSLRITEEKNEYIRKKANEIGVSQNALISILIHLGIKVLEADVSTFLQGE